MSMKSMPFSSGSAETGETIASFTNYEAAQKAVSTLIAADIPAREIAIVGSGLTSIERVTGRLGYGAAARSGAINGLMLGVLFAFIFVLGSPGAAIQAFVGVLLVGIAIGMLLNLLMFTIVRRRRDFASVMQVVADHYDIRVTGENLHRARTALGTVPAARATAAPTAAARRTEPPRYGERIDTTRPAPEAPQPASAAGQTSPDGAATDASPTQERGESSEQDPPR